MAARRKYQDNLQLRTYNEIFIVEENNPPFEYFNCHPRTGLLPYAKMLERRLRLSALRTRTVTKSRIYL
jgi:aldoxime dehydratase